MTIGEAAAASGVSAKMIRYYERIGLIEPAARRSAGYRVYGEADVHVLQFIKRARDVGVPVEKTRDLLALWRDRTQPSPVVKRSALQHVSELEAKISDLNDLVRSLRHLAKACHLGHRPDYPMLDELPEPGGEALRSRAQSRKGTGGPAKREKGTFNRGGSKPRTRRQTLRISHGTRADRSGV